MQEEALEEGAMQEESLEEGELQEEDAMMEGKWWCRYKLMKKLFKSCRKPKPNPVSICSKIVGSGRKSYVPDASCDGGSCRSCDAICAASREGGLMWRCETGYFRIRNGGIRVAKEVPCSRSTDRNTFCCCAEYNDLLFRF